MGSVVNERPKAARGGIANAFGLILLVVAHDPALAVILFVFGAILALYSLLDWLTPRKS
jgi:hypothetical protein